MRKIKYIGPMHGIDVPGVGSFPRGQAQTVEDGIAVQLLCDPCFVDAEQSKTPKDKKEKVNE